MDLINKYHFYINLKKRTEKNKHSISELKRFGIKEPKRFEAITHEIGIVGCVKSHIKCIEIAKERGYPFICIFEDDIIFRNIDKCRDMINKYIYEDYDVLYLGCRVLDNKYEFITDDLIRINSAYTTHAYIIKSHYYDIILKNYYEGMNLKIKAGKDAHEARKSEEYNIDVYLGKLQKVDKWYSFYPHFVSQKDGYSDNFNVILNFSDEIFNIPIHDKFLPKISILTPTFNRKRFLSLMIHNIYHFDYPKEKIEWNILESNDNSLNHYERLFNNKKEIIDLQDNLGIKIRYEYIDSKLSIGEKRNILSDTCSYDYLINMDDDDLYLPNYLNHSIDILMNTDKTITGCLDMLFIYPQKNYQCSFIHCVKDFMLYHEATLCMKKSHWDKHKYILSNKGEGKDIYGDSKLCGLSNITKCMICVCWEGNTVNKDKLLDYKINMNIQGDSLKVLKNIFSEYKMEPVKEETKNIEISEELLKNIRNLIEVANSRVNWKIEELLPIGIMIKQIDELLTDKN
jgi:GR25 family glycosyltransferase involved in LPS biosynthesis